jgi:tetratricopeptide (TPR) repeat protein
MLPHANPGRDPLADQFGLMLTSVVARNLRAVSGLKVIGRETTSRYATARMDLEPLSRDAGASYAIDLTVRQAAPTVDVLARMRRPGVSAPEWEAVLTGDAVDVLRKLLLQLSEVLARDGIRIRRGAETAALNNVPTASGELLLAYARARVLLDYREVAGNPQKAVDLLEGITQKDDRFTIARAALADALTFQYRVDRDSKLSDRAISEARKALQLDPDESAAHVAFGAVERELAHGDSAVTSLRRAIDLQPDNDDAYRLLGSVLAEQRNSREDGIAKLQTAVQLRPSFQNYFALAFALYDASRFTAAIDAYQKASDVRPDNAQAHNMMGVSYQKAGEIRQAIGHYEHALRLAPSPSAQINLALAYYDAGEHDKTITLLQSAIELEPKKAPPYRALGDTYLKLNRRPDARAAYEKAIVLSNADIARNPRDAFATVLVATCEAKLGRHADAAGHAAEAIALRPTNREILFRAAKVYALTAKPSEALKTLQSAIERGLYPAEARRDPDLASLKGLPDFERVLSSGAADNR